jgi:hypothetical protein
MAIVGWIRYGDEAACGAMVAEGSVVEISHGRGYSFVTARMACRKGCTIAEGYPTATLSNGRAQVLHGFLTTGGCPLISTLNGIDGVGFSNASDVLVKFFKNTDGQWTGITAAALASGAVTTPDDEGDYDEQAQLGMGITDGTPYFIETTDGRTFSGRVGADGLPPRVETYGADEYGIVWGDEALAKMMKGEV